MVAVEGDGGVVGVCARATDAASGSASAMSRIAFIGERGDGTMVRRAGAGWLARGWVFFGGAGKNKYGGPTAAPPTVVL